jgi:hypothetical protein
MEEDPPTSSSEVMDERENPRLAPWRRRGGYL